METGGSSDYRKILENCDYEKTKLLVLRFPQMVIPKNLAALLNAYIANPCFDTAEVLIRFDQHFLKFFELSPLGGPTEWFMRSLDKRAEAVMTGLNELNTQVIESILRTYQQVCRGDGRQPGILREREITNETLLRLQFECLCFAIFLAVLGSSHFIKNQRLSELFDGALGTVLLKHCSAAGMGSLSEITIWTMDRAAQSESQQMLDPINRLEEYRRCFVKQKGSEIEHFGKCIGKTLDPPRYSILDLIGGEHAIVLLRGVSDVMSRVFAEDPLALA
jgi:hypothetical protein